MKIYIAGGFSDVFKINRLAKILEKNKHEITRKWWQCGDMKSRFVKLPFKFWLRETDVIVTYRKDMNAICECDMFIFYCSNNVLTGSLIELGIMYGIHALDLSAYPNIIGIGDYKKSAMFVGVHKWYKSIDDMMVGEKLLETKG